MKSKFSIFFLALTGIALLGGCSKAELSEDVSGSGRKVHFVIKSGELKSFVEYDSQTRKYTPKWNQGDELGLYFIGGEHSSELDGVLENVAEDGLKATFEGDVSVPQSEGYFYSFAPASRFALFYADSQFGFNLGDPASDQYVQHPSRSSFDPLCDLLLAKPCRYSDVGGEVVIDDLYFARMFSVLKVNLNGTAVAGDSLSSLKITVDGQVALCGRVAVDPESMTLKRWWVGKPYLWAEYAKDQKPVAGTDAVYLLVNPQTLSEGLELTIDGETNNNTISKKITLQGPMTFRQGNVSVLNLTVREEDCTPKVKAGYVLQTASGAFENGGKYIFAFKDGVSGKYHFLKSVSGTGAANVVESALQVKDGVIYTDDTNYIFEAVLGSSSGMYNFKNVSSGKYIHNSGSGSGLDTGSSGATLWSPVFLSDSGTYKIIATRYISFGSSASTAKAYLDNSSSKCKDQIYQKIALTQYCGAISVFKYNYKTPTLDTPVLSAGEVGKNSISVGWEAVAHASAGYLCQIYNGSDLLEEKNVDASPVSFSGLSPDTPYTIKVRANAVEGEVPFAQSEFGTLDISTSMSQVEDITVAGPYHLTNLLVYSIPKSNTVILGDATGKILLYSNSHGLAVGDLVEISGGVVAYDGVWEFKNNLTISVISSGNPVDHGQPLAMSELTGYASSPSVVYVHLTGNQSGQRITTTGGSCQYVMFLSAASSETDGAAVSSSGYAYGYSSKYSTVDYHALKLVKQGDSPTTLSADWMELPAKVENASYVYQTMRLPLTRNYSMCYNKETYSPVWSAYPLHSSHLSGTQSSSWVYNPGIETKYQIGVTGASYGSNYNASEYSRGHCVPNADRKWNAIANAQTYYVTNQTPQLQQKFNSGIWSALEAGIRSVVTAYSDTVYVVTGVAFRKTGGSETISYLSSTKVSPASLPVPNYFWKAVLKVKRSGGVVVGASAVGVWLEHKQYSASTYMDYTVSVDQIESWTGLDLFANLPAAVQSAAETNADWSVFSKF